MKLLLVALAILSTGLYATEKCESICPLDFSVLKGNDSNFNFMNFKNFSYRGIGKCRGHAIVGQKFSELARFKNNNICNQSELSIECKNEINQGIKNIVNFKTHTFNGFNNLYEFSSHPYVKLKLKAWVRGVSHRYKASVANLRDTSFETKHEAVFYELKMRVKENMQPYIGVKGDTIGHHAIIGYKVMYDEGIEKVCMRDSNILFNTGESCQNFLYLNEYKQVMYHRDNKEPATLYTFQLMSDEDKRLKKYLKAQQNYCISRAQSQGQC